MAKLQIKMQVFFLALLLTTASSVQGIRVLPVDKGNTAAHDEYKKGKAEAMNKKAGSDSDDSDMVDFTNMDYSAAGNKAPIHN